MLLGVCRYAVPVGVLALVQRGVGGGSSSTEQGCPQHLPGSHRLYILHFRRLFLGTQVRGARGHCGVRKDASDDNYHTLVKINIACTKKEEDQIAYALPGTV